MICSANKIEEIDDYIFKIDSRLVDNEYYGIISKEFGRQSNIRNRGVRSKVCFFDFLGEEWIKSLDKVIRFSY
jgi:hypothetical protein